MNRSARNRTKRRWLGVVLATVTAGAVTAACGGSGGAAESSASGSSSTQNKTVTLGLSTIQSGPYAVYGQVGKGIHAYLRTVNEHGGVNGYKFKVTVKDNKYQASRAVVITRQFANSGDLAAFELGTPATQASLRLSDELDLPVIAAANGGLFTPPPAKSVFSIDPEFARMALFQAHFIITKLHTKHFTLAYENDKIGKPSSKVVPKYVKNHGGKLRTSVAVDATATDFSSTAARLKQSGAKVVQAYVGTTAFAGLQKATDAIGYHPTWVTFFTGANPAYTDLVGPLADGVYVSNFLQVSGHSLQKFKRAMKKYYPKLVDSQFAQLGWTQAAVAVKGVEKASHDGAKLTRDSFVKALLSLNGEPAGFLPSVHFGPKSHAAARQTAMFKYNGKELQEVTSYNNLPSLPPGTPNLP